MALRGLILDFGGVLTTPMRRNGEAFERSEGLEPGTYFQALNEDPEGVAVYAALEVGEVTQEHWNRVIGRLLGIDPTDLMRRALANLALEPAMVAVVEKAHAAGVKTALLSNSFGLEPFNVYAELGVLDLFDVVVLSETEGVRKPALQIYARTLELMGLDGVDCVFVDDHEANLPPAKSLGINTIHHAGDAANVATRLRELLG